MFKSVVLFFAILLFLFGFGKIKESKFQTEDDVASLKKVYEKDFYIGAAINDRIITGNDTKALKVLKEEFNSLSPENVMKWEALHPSPDTYNFEMADQYVALGKKNNMHIVGHTLLWHSQIGQWMNSVKDSATMANYIKEHITTVASRYKGKIDTWDVVNEALNEDGSLRESVFLKVMGERYLEFAFKMAEKADPTAELYYNDYNMWKPKKREGAIQLIETLQKNGAKINGVGMQGHWGLTEPSLEEVEKSIIAYSKLGIKVAITELDVTVLPNPWELEGAEISQNFENSEEMNPYPDALPDSVEVQLAERFRDIFKLFLKHSDKIDRVTFWGVNDRSSWLNNWPIKNRTNYPLLFDRKFEPKKAYHAITQLKAESIKQQ
ncbi:endo-1,4-beta-xylanase [Zobellia amurskyensis]|uniref:Beta-xylanase n=1 Tax=Zobellia amurskyensis TaxID=248905 RepID=A0A7X2ZTE1_9FLAO|nr:endo-1,4-beta-xylanase [Zobellia amurskyensis]MUH36068.1 endo-1,4-beta-xylanase [Zobellia amurskyensis]